MFLISKDYWQVQTTKQKGTGVFATNKIGKGIIIGDYIGNLIPYEDVNFEEEKKNMFLMYFNDKLGVLPDLSKPGIHLINHSCSPNCWIYKYKGHTLFFTLRDVEKNEELAISYLLAPAPRCNPCTHQCYCGSNNCTGTMHLTEKKYKKWQKFQKKEFRNIGINGITIENSLKSLIKYPKRISDDYIEKIVELKI